MNWVLSQNLSKSYKNSATVKTESSWYNRYPNQIWSNFFNWQSSFKELKIHNKIKLWMIQEKMLKILMKWKTKLGSNNFWNSLRNKLKTKLKFREMMKLSLKILQNKMIKWWCLHLKTQKHQSRKCKRSYLNQK